jgi:hypothetical protein
MSIQFLPPLLEAILGGYAQETPTARDAHVLSLTGKIVLKSNNIATVFLFFLSIS